jgi:hypothetical protein
MIAEIMIGVMVFAGLMMVMAIGGLIRMRAKDRAALDLDRQREQDVDEWINETFDRVQK